MLFDYNENWFRGTSSLIPCRVEVLFIIFDFELETVGLDCLPLFTAYGPLAMVKLSLRPDFCLFKLAKRLLMLEDYLSE